MRDPYLYPDSEVLKNLVNIRDEKVLKDMNHYSWNKVPFDDVVTAFSNFMARLWKVHPFREGNTRTVVTFCSMFIETQGFYIESDLFKDHATYMRNALVAATAIFHDLGDLRKPEYLYRIVQDALDQGREMKLQVEEALRQAGKPVNADNIKKIVLWNRQTNTQHTVEEKVNLDLVFGTDKRNSK